MDTQNSNLTPPITHQKILSATLVLFSQKGYFSTSVRDISRESGVSIGSIYHHFKDKEGVAKAMYNHLLDRIQTDLSAIYTDNTTAHDRCFAVIAFLFNITEQEPDVMEFMLYSKHRDFLPDENPICSSKPFELMRLMVKDGMTSGEVQEMDIMVASSCLFGAAIRLITSRLDGLIDNPLPEYLESVWSCSWKSVSIANSLPDKT